MTLSAGVQEGSVPTVVWQGRFHVLQTQAKAPQREHRTNFNQFINGLMAAPGRRTWGC